MSYRDLRNCAEMLRALGFPRLISMENFRNPNFPLVAELLSWVVKRFDPSSDLPTEVDAEQDRVIFIRSVAQFMATKTHVRLNTKKLYGADGHAVKEILKCVVLLYSALTSNEANARLGEEEGETTLNFDVTNKINELKQIRSLASDITTRGATLFDLLRREVDLREIRVNIVNRQLELTEVERGMQSAIRAVEDEYKKNQTSIENVGSDENNLEAKIEKKKTGLERSQKRLQTLKKVRPAFMDEYEKLESDLKKYYEFFIQRFMCLAFLEQQLDDLEKAEQDKMVERECANRKFLEKVQAKDGSLDSDGDDDSDDDDDDDEDDDEDEDEEEDPIKSLAKNSDLKAMKKSSKGSRRLFGSMTGADLDSESLDSDTDLNLEGDGDTDLGSEDEFNLRGMAGGGRKGGGGPAAAAGREGAVGGGLGKGGARPKLGNGIALGVGKSDDDDF